MLENIVTLFLCLAPFPSLIAWSQGATGISAILASHVGPINPLKLAAPLFAFYLWKKRSEFQQPALRFLALLLVVGTMFALHAGIRCGHPFLEMREWAVMVVGCIAGGCLVALPRRKLFTVISAWTGIIFFSVFLELVFPEALKWLVARFFDPSRAGLDKHGIMGFWDIGSMAKMSMMMTWIFGFGLSVHPRFSSRPRALWAVFSAFAIVLFLIILGTTQRGPILGFAFGTAALVALEIRRTRTWRILGIAAALGVLASTAAWIILPHDVLLPRIKTMFFMKDNSKYGHDSAVSMADRIRINRLTFATLRSYPLGNACIAREEYARYSLDPLWEYHAHSLLLQQYRAKGWIWGTLHLLLWVWALLLAYRMKTLPGTFVFAGLCAVFGLGLVDHPWFVLNQATMIGTLLLASFRRGNLLD